MKEPVLTVIALSLILAVSMSAAAPVLGGSSIRLSKRVDELAFKRTVRLRIDSL